MYQYRYPNSDLIQQFCKVVPSGETGQSVQGIFLCFYLHVIYLHVIACESTITSIKILVKFNFLKKVHQELNMCMLSLQSCLTLCDPMDCSPPGCSVRGILQARILEWVAMPSSRESSPPRDSTRVSFSSCIAGGFFIAKPPEKP